MSIHQSGKKLIALLYALTKACQIYDLNNDVVVNAGKKLYEFINSLFDIFERLELVRYRDYIFFNKQRLRFEIDGYASLQFIDNRLKHLNIKSLTILNGIDINQVMQFAVLFKETKSIFMNEIKRKRFPHILIEFKTTEDEIPEFLQDGERTKKVYFKALRVTKNLMQNLWVNKTADVRSSKRVVYNLIDTLSQDEFGLLALTTIKNFDEYTFNHSLNVGVLSLALGQRIGLSKRDLVKLGTAGLLHDIGKVEIDKGLIYKPQKLTDSEWEIIKLHSNFGVRQILKTRGLDEVSLYAMVVSFQHHWNQDGTGYPQRNNREKPILFSRIVRIADSYDAMTTSRPYQPVPYIPPLAIRVLWAKREFFFDPVLTKVFIQLLGLYPVGSCLQLSTQELALVVRQNPGYVERPFVKIILTKSGQKIDGRTIDLSMDTSIKIIKPVYPQKYGINPAAYFV